MSGDQHTVYSLSVQTHQQEGVELGILEDFLYEVLLFPGTVRQTLHLLQGVQHLGHSSLWKENLTSKYHLFTPSYYQLPVQNLDQKAKKVRDNRNILQSSSDLESFKFDDK